MLLLGEKSGKKPKASLKIPALQENQDIPTLPSTTFPRAGQAQEVNLKKKKNKTSYKLRFGKKIKIIKDL